MRDRCLLQMRSAFEHLINRREHKCNGWGNFDQPQSGEKKRSGSKRAETAERAARQQISIYLSLKVRYLMTRHGGNLMRKFSLIGAYWSHVPLCLLAVGRSVNSQRRLLVCYCARSKKTFLVSARSEKNQSGTLPAREQRPN